MSAPNPSTPEATRAATKHTPGPWRVDKDSPLEVLADFEGRELLVAETFDEKVEAGDGKADARLIAAAPDMLAFLLRLRENDVPEQEELEALIAKVEAQ